MISKENIIRFGYFLDKIVPLILIIMFVYFSFQAARLLQGQQAILEQIDKSNGNQTRLLLCEFGDLPGTECQNIIEVCREDVE